MRWWRGKNFWWKVIPVMVLAVMIGKFGICHSMADWKTASRASAGIAPDPATHREAIVQVYGARAFGWRGYFGVHTWVAVKPTNAADFTVYEVIGWQVRRGAPAIYISNRPADGRWFDAMPEILADVRGARRPLSRERRGGPRAHRALGRSATVVMTSPAPPGAARVMVRFGRWKVKRGTGTCAIRVSLAMSRASAAAAMSLYFFLRPVHPPTPHAVQHGWRALESQRHAPHRRFLHPGARRGAAQGRPALARRDQGSRGK